MSLHFSSCLADVEPVTAGAIEATRRPPAVEHGLQDAPDRVQSAARKRTS